MNWKGNLKKKLTAVLSAGVLAVTGTVSAMSGMTASAQPSAGTYGDALKLSLYFFDANQCGADDNVLTWRGKCHTYDAEASLSSAVQRDCHPVPWQQSKLQTAAWIP